MEDLYNLATNIREQGAQMKKKKDSLKLVPVIQEVFSKWNIDDCGSLPFTTNGNHYVLIVMCMVLKYPEAILLADMFL